MWYEDSSGTQVKAVAGAALTVEPGERVGLVGASGSGKSTVMLAILGLLPDSAWMRGQVLWKGTDIVAGGDRTIRPHRWSDIAMVLQATMSALNPVRTIGAQIVEPMELHGTASGAAARRRAGCLLQEVGLSPSTVDRYPHELSGGMRQRAAIAMALACQPRVLLADEPTTGLDVLVQAEILGLLVRLSTEQGLSLVVVSHDLAVIAQICQKAVVMDGGHVVETATLEALCAAPRHRATRLLLDADAGRAQSLQPAKVMPDAGAGGAPAVLEIRDLVVAYSTPRRFAEVLARRPRHVFRAVNGVSLSLRRGEVLALVGDSGGGKTTTALAILSLVEPRSGEVLFDGLDLVGMSQAQLKPIRAQMQMVFQDPYESLGSRQRVSQLLEEPLLVHASKASSAERQRRSAEALSACGLAPPEAYLGRFPHELSGGQRQRVAIAAGLILDPGVLIADEPVSMLDASLRLGILSLLRDLCRRRHMALLVITHDLSSAALLADRVAVMHEGRIVEDSTTGEVMARPQHPHTKKLIAAIPRLPAGT